MDVTEFPGEVFVSCLVKHFRAGDERHVGDGQVNASVLHPCFLKALYLHLGIRVEQREDSAGGAVNLNGMD